MFKYVFYLVLVLLIFYMYKNHIKIKFKTFFKKGFHIDKSPFGIYCFHNKQGSGKSMSAVSFLLENTHMPIYANMKSLKGIEYYYYSGFKTLLDLGTTLHDCIIFYDELFKGLFKGKKLKPEEKELLLDFMSQMRKRNIIFITTAQEWLMIDIDFRRYVRYDIEVSLKSFFGIPILKKIFHDTEQIKWSDEENEYVSPIINTVIEHGRKKIVNSYDTFEIINTEEIAPILTYNPYIEFDYKIPPIHTYFSSSNRNILQDTKLINNMVKNYELEHFKNIKEEKFKKDNENFLIFLLKKLLKSVKHKLSLFTTTIKKACAMCQFTNKFTLSPKKNNMHNLPTLDNIDNDFWENETTTSLEESVK